MRILFIVIVWMTCVASQAQSDSAAFYRGVYIGVNPSKLFDAHVFYDWGYQLEVFSKIASKNGKTAYYIEYGMSNLRENGFLKDYNIEQKAHYMKVGIELAALDPFYVGIAAGPTFVQERAYWLIPGVFFDDYVEERYHDRYVNMVTTMYAGVSQPIYKSLYGIVNVGITARTRGNTPDEYHYYIPGFGFSFIGDRVASVNYSVGLMFQLD